MANLSNIIPPAGVVTPAGTQTITNKTLVDPILTLGAGQGTAGQVPVSQGAGLAPVWGAVGAEVIRVARTSNTALTSANKGNLIDITSGTFTQTFDAAATLGSGWFAYIRNSGTGDITLDPNASETIDGLTSFVMYPGEVRLVQCDGTALRSVVLNSFYRVFTASGTFTTPPGYRSFIVDVVSGGGGGGGGLNSSTAGGGGGGGGGGRFVGVVDATSVSSSISVAVGAGGTGGAVASSGAAGGDSSFGSLVTVFGGAAGGTSIGTSNTSYLGGGGGGFANFAPTIGENSAIGGLGAGVRSEPEASGVAWNGGSSLNSSNSLPDSRTYASAVFGGGAGGGGNSSASQATLGGRSIFGAGGGGGGAYQTVSAGDITAGKGSGGTSGVIGSTLGALMTSTHGQNGADAASLRFCGGGGAGGNSGGIGGNGGYPGGGGGGGATRSSNTGGAGGNGAAGRVVVYGSI
jgi:hypothetical protein